MSQRALYIVAIAALAILSLAILANSMTKAIGRDEQMYCTGAVLLGGGKMIYRDFSYAAQMPYHPLLYAALFKAMNTSRYLLVGRLVSSVCDILVVACILGTYRRVFGTFRAGGILFGLAGAVLYVFNPVVDYANGYAWNHDVVILLVAASLWLSASADLEHRPGCWRTAAVGALLTLATCMRITTALVEILFFIVLAARAGSARQKVKSMGAFAGAAAIVLAWPAWVIAQGPAAFMLNLFKIPSLYGQWLHKIGMTHSKAGLTWYCLTRPGYLVLLVMAVYLCVAAAFLRRRLERTDGRHLLLAALLPVVFFVIALIPPTMWMQYMAAPVPFIVMGVAYPLAYLGRLRGGKAGPGGQLKAAAALTVVCVLIAVAGNPAVLSRAPFALLPESWVPMELHRISSDVAGRTKEPKLALTLAPLFALEGGCAIYPELSAGAIIYRIADQLSAEERATTKTVGPRTLGELAAKSPPSAVIVGVEDMKALEKPLVDMAVKAGWERKAYESGPVVYLRR